MEVVYTTPESEPLPFRGKSTKFPQLQNFPHLLAFLQKVTDDVNKLTFTIDPDSNLSLEQTRALRELASIKTLVIKPSDKGGNIVLMDSKQYEAMYLDLLRNQDWYRAVPDSFNLNLQAKYQSIVGDAANQGIYQ